MPKILLLGAGFVAGPCLQYILRHQENSVTVACRTLASAQELAQGHGARAVPCSLDVKDAQALLEAVEAHDVVVSLIPYTYHPLVIEAAIKARKHFVSTSYISAAMLAYDEAAKDAGITVMNEIGVDPGIDHLYAKQIIDRVHAEGGKIDEFTSFCGGLPAPEASNNPLGYKFSWSARGVLLAAGNSAKFLQDGRVMEIKAPHVLGAGTKEIPIYPAFAFEGYPNRDSTPYSERYSIPEAKTLIRGTLRYKGNPAFVKSLAEVGFLNDDPQEYLQASSPRVAWRSVMGRVLGVQSEDEAALAVAYCAKAGLNSSPEQARILAGVKWLGLFSDEPAPQKSSLLDSLAHHLAAKMKYAPGERDMIMMQHKFHITKADGSKEVRTSTMLEYGIPFGATAMARTVGIPCAIAVQLILDGGITQRGVIAPLTPELYDPIIELLEKEGLSCKEEVVVM